jgi:hypothetical protein
MKIMVRVIVCMFLASMTICAISAAGETQSSPAATPIGTMVTTTVERGDSYGGGEQYDLRITVKEVVSGEKAWIRLKEANDANEPPKTGFKYLLVFVRAEFSARGFPGDKDYRIRDDQFIVIAGNGKEFTKASVVKPKPEFVSMTMTSGSSYEGWIAFLVQEDEKKLLMSFSRDHDDGAVYGIWQKPLFRLY